MPTTSLSKGIIPPAPPRPARPPACPLAQKSPSLKYKPNPILLNKPLSPRRLPAHPPPSLKKAQISIL